MKVKMHITKDGTTAEDFSPMVREFDDLDEIGEKIEAARERAEEAGYTLEQDIEFGDETGSSLSFVINDRDGAKLVGKITGLKSVTDNEELRNILS